jgi:hypothetical protein
MKDFLIIGIQMESLEENNRIQLDLVGTIKGEGGTNQFHF